MSYHLIKKMFDNFFNMKKDLKESLRMYVKRFKEEKTIIVGYDDTMANSAFKKRLLTDHLLLGELIMG